MELSGYTKFRKNLTICFVKITKRDSCIRKQNVDIQITTQENISSRILESPPIFPNSSFGEKIIIIIIY